MEYLPAASATVTDVVGDSTAMRAPCTGPPAALTTPFSEPVDWAAAIEGRTHRAAIAAARAATLVKLGLIRLSLRVVLVGDPSKDPTCRRRVTLIPRRIPDCFSR